MTPARAIPWVALAMVGVGVLGTALASRAWAHDEAGTCVVWTVVALLALAGVALLLVPGPVRLRPGGVGLVLALVSGFLGLTGVVSPRSDVSAAYDGDGVSWSRLVPAGQRGDGLISSITVLSDTRAVVTRDEHVLVIDPRDGRTVKAFDAVTSSRFGPTVGRTVDGFVLQDSGRFRFFGSDGETLADVTGDRVLARAPGISVVADCSRTCEVAAYGDGNDDEPLWRDESAESATIPIADEMPAGYDAGVLDVVPRTILVRPQSAGLDVFEELAAETGEVVRSFPALHAGTTLPREGRPMTFAVQPVEGSASECTVLVIDGSVEDRSEPFDCASPQGVTGDHLVFIGESSSTIVDLPDASTSQLSPPAQDGEGRPPVLAETGVGGTVVLRLTFGPDGAAEPASRAATGGTWGMGFGEWWTYTTAADVTGVEVGESSALVSSKVAPLNPWDSPAEDERELAVVDLSSGDRVGGLRIDKAIDDSAGLSDGAMLVALQGGRILRIGPDST